MRQYALASYSGVTYPITAWGMFRWEEWGVKMGEIKGFPFTDYGHLLDLRDYYK